MIKLNTNARGVEIFGVTFADLRTLVNKVGEGDKEVTPESLEKIINSELLTETEKMAFVYAYGLGVGFRATIGLTKSSI